MSFKMYVDEEGVPYGNYGVYTGVDMGRKNSVLAVAERGLWYWNEFNLSGSGEQVLLSYDWTKWPINKEQNPETAEAARTMMIHCADWLMNNLTDRGSHLLWCYDYPISYGVQAGWGSAHAQAVGLQLLLRASELDDGSYLAPVEGLLRAFDVTIEDGGLLDNSVPQLPWFEKFASPESQRPKVLNGMLFTLLGLHDIANRTGLETARRLYEVGLRSVLWLMDRYDLGDWSAYDIQGKPASPHYHHIHVEQLDRLFHIEGNIRFAQWRDRFASYQPPPGPEHDWLKPEVDNLQKERDKLKKQLRAIRNSFSYRLGNILVQAVVSPGRNTILLPYRLIRLCIAGFKKRRTMAAKHPAVTRPPVPSSAIYSFDYPISDETIEAWIRSANYTAIMTVVSPGNDPELFYANQALDNIIHVWPRLEPYQYENEIDWGVSGKSNTWYLYFQSLRVVGYLANGAEVSGDVRYLAKAAEIIESWFDFHHDNKIPPRYAWNDHATASRSHNVMHFLRAYKSLQDVHLRDSFFEKVATMLCQLGSWLMDKRKYHPNNHGMMASMALTQLAFTFPEFDAGGLWKEMGISRIRERIEDDLSTENVHLEHSASYHRVFLALVLQIEGYLDTQGVALFDPGDKTVEEMKQYLAYMVKPNRRLPMIGDTSDGVLSNHYNHPWIIYSLSNGEEEVRPPNNSMVYPDAGVAILRDEWKTGSDFAETTYLMFQSSFTYHTGHKHADDLGFILYSHGEDIFVGPGVYAYDSSKYRQYVRSAQAHNTLTVDGKSYALSLDNVGKASITAYRLEEAFDFVQGSHTMYEGVTLKRGIVFIRPSTILIIDEAVSGTQHSIQQIWNLSPAADDLKFDRDGASFLVGENGVHVELRQFCPATGVNHYYGQEEQVRGFIAPQQRKLVPVHQLEFESYGSGIVFVTQISVAGPGEDIPTIDVDLNNPYRDIVVRHSDGATLTINLEAALQP